MCGGFYRFAMQVDVGVEIERDHKTITPTVRFMV
jgi:hypothetical protein